LFVDKRKGRVLLLFVDVHRGVCMSVCTKKKRKVAEDEEQEEPDLNLKRSWWKKEEEL
jgi:hypothetical protein